MRHSKPCLGCYADQYKQCWAAASPPCDLTMSAKYLLYIDILGFSDLVDRDPARIPSLYEIVDSLHVHAHHAFKTLVFSDTIIVFNIHDPKSDYDHRYLVMYACEFAQDLFYRLVGKGIYFRGILTYGDFTLSELNNLQAFYGRALVSAYRRQQAIRCVGLFIDTPCLPHNAHFPTARYDQELHFVYLTSSLEKLHSVYQDHLPVDRLTLEQTDELWGIGWDVTFLKEIHALMSQHPSPEVRAKHQATWQFYRSRYPALLNSLEASGFDMSIICPEFDWHNVRKRIREE